MAEAEISNVLRITGIDEVIAQLRRLGAAGSSAFGAMEKSAGTVGPAVSKVSQDVDKLGQDVARLSQSTAQAQTSTDNLAKSMDQASQSIRQADTSARSMTQTLATIAVRVGVVSLALGAAGTAAFLFVKNTLDIVNTTKDAAESAKTSVQSYQQMIFSLRQMGLSQKQAEETVKTFGDTIKDSTTKAAKAMADLGLRFPKTEEGARAAAAAMVNLSNSSTGVKAGFDKTQQAILLGNKALVDFDKSRDQGVRGLAAFADALSKIKDPTKQAEVAQAALGKEVADKLLPILKDGGEAVLKYSDDFKKLGLGFTPDNIKNAEAFKDAIQEFRNELVRLGAVSENNRVNLASTFSPLVTPLIKGAAEALHEFTNALAGNRISLAALGQTIATAVTPVIRGFLTLLRGETTGVPQWMVSARDGAVALGRTISSVFSSVLTPAFRALQAVIQSALGTVNEFFGIDLKPSDFTLLTVLTSLIGGFKTLALGLAAVFVGSGTGLDNFREKLKGFGIDVREIETIVVHFVRVTMTDLKNAFSGSDSNVTQAWVITLRDGLKQLPAIIVAVVAALILLRGGLNSVAGLVTAVFRVPVSGLQLGLVAVLGQLTGILPLFISLLVGAAAATTILVNGVRLLGIALAAIVAVIGWPLTLAIAIGVLIVNIEKAKAIADALARSFNALFGTNVTGGELLTATFLALSAALVITTVKAVGAGVAITALSGAVTLLGTRLGPVVAAFVILSQIWELLKETPEERFKRLSGQVKDTGDKAKESATGVSAWQRALDEARKTIEGFKPSESGLEETRRLIDDMKKSLQQLTPEAQKAATTTSGIKIVKNPFVSQTPEGGNDVTKQAADSKKALDDTGKAEDQLKDKTKALGDQIKETPALDVAPKNTEQTFTFLDRLKQNLEAIKSFLGNLFSVTPAGAAEAGAGAGGAGGDAEAKAAALVLPFQIAQQRIQEIAAEISTSFDDIPAAVAEALAQVGATAQAAFDQVGEIARNAVDSIGSAFDQLPGRVGNSIQQIIKQLQEMAQAAQAAADAVSSATSSSGGGGASEPFARGGLLGGRPGVDTNLARFSRGEFFMNKAAVNYWGVPFMRAVNNMNNLPGFALGGLVGDTASSVAPAAFDASGLPVVQAPQSQQQPSGRPLTLNLTTPSGQTIDTFSARMTDDEAGRLERVAVRATLRRTQKPSSWNR